MITLVYSGGTIGCTGRPLAPMPVEDFRALWNTELAPTLPTGDEALDWRWIEPPLDSSAMTAADWGALAEVILTSIASGATGAVLLHGTDTMAWTAAALAMLSVAVDDEGAPTGRLATPVVLTGAQRPLFSDGTVDPGSDAPANAALAFEAVAEAGAGVRVAFGGAILPGARVCKTSTTDDTAFAAPNGPGEMGALPAAAPNRLLDQLAELRPHLGRRAVLVVTPTPNDPGLLRDTLSASIDRLGDRLGALHLQGYGIGNFPGEEIMAPLFAGLRDRGVLVTVGTQAWRGRVEPAAYDAGNWLTRLGVIGVRDMVLPAVTAKLHLALALAAARGWPADRARRFFLTPLAGEVAAQ